MHDITDDEFELLGYLLYPYDVQLYRESEGKFDATIDHSDKARFRITHDKDESEAISYEHFRECSKRMRRVMEPRVTAAYRLATSLPFQYTRVPQAIRNRFLKKRIVDFDLSGHLSLEKMRVSIVQELGKVGVPLQRRHERQILITHDIDTERGLRNALSLKAVEEKLNLRSTWFLPSQEYRIPKKVARDLGSNSRIGSHDVKHDGRIICASNQEQLIERLTTSRLQLEGIFETEVDCFRSPLLQFNRKIVTALAKSGYRGDFSLPTWEPSSPYAADGFGAEIAQPFAINGVVETPLTLFQDHQVFYVLNMNPATAVKFWTVQARVIRSLCGDIVLNVHPDYLFSQHLEAYGELLMELANIHNETQTSDGEKLG